MVFLEAIPLRLVKGSTERPPKRKPGEDSATVCFGVSVHLGPFICAFLNRGANLSLKECA